MPTPEAAVTISRPTRRSRSLYYGGAVSLNAFPGYSTADLERDLGSVKIDPDTRAKIEAEIARRSAATPRRSGRR